MFASCEGVEASDRTTSRQNTRLGFDARTARSIIEFGARAHGTEHHQHVDHGGDHYGWVEVVMSDSRIPWKRTRRFAVGLTISVAAFSAWDALAPHIPMAAGGLVAALYGNSQGLANCMAANARGAWERGGGYNLPAFFFTLCFAGFALLSTSGHGGST
jgi:hypothetical protein